MISRFILATLALAISMSAAHSEHLAPALQQELTVLSPQLEDMLATTFPTEFEDFTAKANAAIAQGSEAGALVMAYIATLGAKYEIHIGAAPEIYQKSVLHASSALYQRVAETNGSIACNNLALQNLWTVNVDTLSAEDVPVLVGFWMISLQAGKQGFDSPTAWAAPTEADWGMLALEASKNGMSAAGYAALSGGNVSKPEMCGALVIMLHTMASGTNAGINAVRAHYLSQVTAP